MNRNVVIKGEQLLQTLWVGGLVSVGYLAVPILFSSLDDRRLAGAVAGQIFSAMNIVGFICGGALLLSAVVATKSGWFRSRRVQVLLAMLLLVAVAALVMQPMMQELKAAGLAPGSEEARRFGQLHGISSIIYMINVFLGLYLVMQARPSERA